MAKKVYSDPLYSTSNPSLSSSCFSCSHITACCRTSSLSSAMVTPTHIKYKTQFYIMYRITQQPCLPIWVRLGLRPLKVGSTWHGGDAQEGAVVQGDGDGHAGSFRLLAWQPLVPGMPCSVRTNLLRKVFIILGPNLSVKIFISKILIKLDKDLNISEFD